MTSENKPAIRIDSLNHAYREARHSNVILKNISLTIPSNTTVALLGQSGSGKSTLLNLISGLEPVQSGSIDVLDQPLQNLTDRERTLFRRHRVGFIYQSFNLVPTLTVGENIALPLTLIGASRKTVIDRVRESLKITGLEKREDSFPDRLSGGEQQRVAIARALIHTPDLILADEPTGNLDAETGRKILDILLATVSNTVATLILVTHSSEVADRADAVLTLQNGGIIATDNRSGDPSTAW